MKRTTKEIAKRILFLLHVAGLKFGFIVLPKHYYVPIPDLFELRRTRKDWAHRSGMVGVDVDLDRQVRTLRDLVKPFEPEYRGNAVYKHAVAGAFGPGYGYIEAQALHGMIRALAPKRVIEIGSGVSTHCMIEAAKLNGAGRATSFTCIEPNPSPWLLQAPVTLIKSRVQNVELGAFETLEAGDLLFVDSTHVVRTDSDVNRIILEILPRLKPGIIVHFHDINLPYDYQPNTDHTLFQWMETALLHAFLIGNRRFEILFCLSQLYFDRRDALKEVFPEFNPHPITDGLLDEDWSETTHYPSAIYLKVVA